MNNQIKVSVGWLDVHGIVNFTFVYQQLRNHLFERLLDKIQTGFSATPVNLDYLELSSVGPIQSSRRTSCYHPGFAVALWRCEGTTGTPSPMCHRGGRCHYRTPKNFDWVTTLDRNAPYQHWWVFQQAPFSDVWKNMSSLSGTSIVPSVTMNLIVWLHQSSLIYQTQATGWSEGDWSQWATGCSGEDLQPPCTGLMAWALSQGLSSLGCVVRRKYSVPGPLSLVPCQF